MAKDAAEVLPIESEVAALERALLNDEVPEIQDPEEIAKSIMLRIMQSENLDEIFQQGAAVHASEMLDRPFRAHDFRFHKSSFEDGPGLFAVIDAEFLDGGDRVAMTCGGRNIMAQLLALKKTGNLPCDVKISESERPTAAGFKVLWLHRAKD